MSVNKQWSIASQEGNLHTEHLARSDVADDIALVSEAHLGSDDDLADASDAHRYDEEEFESQLWMARSTPLQMCPIPTRNCSGKGHRVASSSLLLSRTSPVGSFSL